MKDIKITALKRVQHDDLIEKYENPLEQPCSIQLRQTFISKNATMPAGFCNSAWQSVYPFVFTLASGGEDIYDGWMKNKKSAMISCNDGFRPVSFLLEVIE